MGTENTLHACDEDCAPFIDPETDECTRCGVWRAEFACGECGGRSFHRDDCAYVAEQAASWEEDS